MSFTTQSLDTAVPSTKLTPSELDLPSKEFVGYDPKGTTSVTGSPIERPAATEPDDAKQPSTNEAPEESVTLSPKISALARKEQAIRRREIELRNKERELEARLGDSDKYKTLKEKLAAKDYSAAEELGLSHEEYTQHLLKKQESEDPATARYQKLESELESLKKAREEDSVKEYQANQALWKAEISKVVSASPEFSSIKELNAEEIVLQHINDSFEEDGIELSAEEAAKEIEAALVERAEKFASLTKVKKKFEEAPKTLPPPKASKTITQTMTTTPVKSSTRPLHMMSESEQWAEATRRYLASKQSSR
jgi:uncharacterized protein YukE